MKCYNYLHLYNIVIGFAYSFPCEDGSDSLVFNFGLLLQLLPEVAINSRQQRIRTSTVLSLNHDPSESISLNHIPCEVGSDSLSVTKPEENLHEGANSNNCIQLLKFVSLLVFIVIIFLIRVTLL